MLLLGNPSVQRELAPALRNAGLGGEKKMEAERRMVDEIPFNVDCWVISPEAKCRLLTHFHGDHIPCKLPVEIVVPFDVKFLTESSQYLSEKYSHYFKEQKTNMHIEAVGKVKHIHDDAAVLKIKFKRQSSEKIVILVGDYDAPEWEKLAELVKRHQPDYFIFPVYTRFVSGQKGRLQRNSKHLSEAQRTLVREIKRIKRDLGKPVIVGLAHSKKAEKLRELDIFIEYSQRIPSLDNYRDGLVECGSMEICKGCQRVRNHHRSKC